MLVDLKFNEIDAKLNLLSLGNDYIGAYISYPISDSKGFENVPCTDNWYFTTRICSIGFYVGNTEFKIGPSLAREWGRYEKRFIDSEAQKLKGGHDFNKIEIDKVMQQCVNLADYDLSNVPREYTTSIILGLLPITINTLINGFSLDIKTATSIIPMLTLIASSKSMQGTDAGERFAKFETLLNTCGRIDQECIEQAYKMGMELCSFDNITEYAL